MLAAILLAAGSSSVDATTVDDKKTTVRLQGRASGRNAPQLQIKINLFELVGELGPHENRGRFLGLTRPNEGGFYSYQVEPGCYVIVAIAPDGWLFINRFGRDPGKFHRAWACLDGSEPIVDVVAGRLVKGP